MRERSGDNGARIIDVMVDRIRAELVGDIHNGKELSRAIEQSFGLKRSAGSYCWTKRASAPKG